MREILIFLGLILEFIATVSIIIINGYHPELINTLTGFVPIILLFISMGLIGSGLRD